MIPENIQTALQKVVCSKMRRAWRNRSNATHLQWIAYIRMLRGTADANSQRVEKFAACLYVACGWYASRTGSGIFVGRDVPTRGWALIGLMTEDFLINPPDRALTLGAWKQRREAEAKARAKARKESA